MKFRLVPCLIALAAHPVTPAPAALERSVSTSRQFLVFGTDVRLRGAICDVAEQAKAILLRATLQRDLWKTPILINAEMSRTNVPEAPPAALRFSQTGDGLKLQLDLTIGTDFDAVAVQREIFRALILEFAYRENPDVAPGTAFAEPPAWLADGLVELGGEPQTSSRDEAFSALANSKRLMPLPVFVRDQTAPTDSNSRSLRRAQSLALLHLLFELPEGRKRLGKFIRALPSAGADDFVALTETFPELKRPPTEVDALWSSAIKRLAAARSSGVMTVEETERTLDDLLRFPLPAGHNRTARIEQFPDVLAAPGSERALRLMQQKLLAFSGRAHPLYAPVIAGYEKVVSELARRKTKKIPQQLAALKALRERMKSWRDHVADYLNWFEATQSQRQSGAFDDYLRTVDRAASPEARRRDAISVYLDALEAQFAR